MGNLVAIIGNNGVISQMYDVNRHTSSVITVTSILAAMVTLGGDETMLLLGCNDLSLCLRIGQASCPCRRDAYRMDFHNLSRIAISG
jgi:hypothetical protein